MPSAKIDNTSGTHTANAISLCDLKAKDRRIQRSLILLREFQIVRDVARCVNISESRLRHLFKREIGISPGHYLKLCRLERGKQLIESSFLSVKEITALVGLTDVSHFVREYKKFYKHTPGQARASLNRISPSEIADSANK
jgi:AraC-like DNA-binding protein